MNGLLLSRVTMVWAVLVGVTVLSFCMGHGVGLEDSRLRGVLILLMGFIKVRLVVREFMEVRHAPGWLRHTFELWGLGASLLLVGLWLRSPA